jgi:hypothetical protein
LLIFISPVDADVSTVDSPEVYFPLASSFQFQQDTATLLMNVTVGNINSTTNDIIQQTGLSLSNWQWIWIFTPLEDCSISFVFPNETTFCYINKNQIDNNYVGNFTLGSNYEIFWENRILPAIPFTFIMGIVGLGCMFIGPWIIIDKLRKKEYEKALVTGFLVTFIGFAFFVGWVFTG